MKKSLKETLEFLGAIRSAGNDAKSLPSLLGKRARTRTFYISGTADALGANNGSMIVASTKKETGFTNFESGNILPKGSNLLVIAQRLLFDTTVGATPLTATFTNNAPANWKNGELTVRQGEELFNASITDLSNFKASTGNDDDFRELEIPYLLRPDSSFEFIAKLAPGTTANQVFKLELRVIEFIDGDKA